MSQPKPTFRSGSIRQLYRDAIAAGWTFEVSGTTHVVIISPSGVRIWLSTTVNDKGRAAANSRAKARRAGLYGKRGQG